MKEGLLVVYCRHQVLLATIICCETQICQGFYLKGDWCEFFACDRIIDWIFQLGEKNRLHCSKDQFVYVKACWSAFIYMNTNICLTDLKHASLYLIYMYELDKLADFTIFPFWKFRAETPQAFGIPNCINYLPMPSEFQSRNPPPPPTSLLALLKFQNANYRWVSVILRWPNTVCACACAKYTITFKLFTLWRQVFARAKVNQRSIYSCILARVSAVAMATGLVKTKA